MHHISNDGDIHKLDDGDDVFLEHHEEKNAEKVKTMTHKLLQELIKQEAERLKSATPSNYTDGNDTNQW